jgi:hypothetical protein
MHPAQRAATEVVRRRRRRPPLPVLATGLVGALTFWAYGGGFPNTDASWTLVWGRELLHLQTPSFAEGATPHPLTNALGIVAATVPSASETVLQTVGYLAVGALVVAAFSVGRTLGGVVAGVVAAVLLGTRDTLVFYGALGYVDVLFAALVLCALALEVARPRRGVAVLLVLGLAGLARPDAWLLSACYWLYALPADRRRRLQWAALIAVAPLLWLLADLALTGDPLFSFIATQNATVTTGRPTGIDGLLTEGPRILARAARPDVCIAALITFVAAWRRRGVRLLVGATAVSAWAVAIPVILGTPLNDRYLITTMALLCIAAAVGVALLGSPHRQLAGASCLIVLLIGTVDEGPRLVERRASVVDRTARRSAARDVVRPGVPCTPVVVPNERFVPVVASWLDLPLSNVRDGRSGIPRGSYVWGDEAAMKNLLVIEGRPGSAALAPDAPVIRRRGGWTLSARC